MPKTLAILAAGMGSRYGGLKQIDTIGSNGETIIDFTIYDAIEAGFDKLVLIIRKEHKQAFEQNLVHKFKDKIEVVYAYQDLLDVPNNLEIPSGREKPWGTSHALLACRHVIDEDFVICNADDYYGKDAFKQAYDFIQQNQNKNQYAMVAYQIENTLSDHGTVTRGICEVENQLLKNIQEVSSIKKENDAIVYEQDHQWLKLDGKAVASMNFWIFNSSIFNVVKEIFDQEIFEGIKTNPLKYEALLPNYVGQIIKNNYQVKVLTSSEEWFGVTYQADKPIVVKKIQAFKDQGLYPDNLWQ